MCVCVGNKPRQPSCNLAGILKYVKDWPCAVNFHFAGQHPFTGHVYIYILYIHIYIYSNIYIYTHIHIYNYIYIHMFIMPPSCRLNPHSLRESHPQPFPLNWASTLVSHKTHDHTSVLLVAVRLRPRQCDLC